MTTVGSRLDFARLYDRFDAPVTDFDCGQLCAPLNDGIPVCCHGESVIPVLYKGELKMLLERTELWSRWVPQDEEERELEEDHDEFALATCKGVQHCERDNRSLNCRTFPLFPYFDHDDELAGLVYDYEAAEGKCPLVEMPQVVTVRYIEQALEFWAALAAGDERERKHYLDESATLRRRFGREREPVPVLTVDGVRDYPTTAREWKSLTARGRRPELTRMQRPRG